MILLNRETRTSISVVGANGKFYASRGPIVDEQALISVLKNKHIAGAAIDVFDTEPLLHRCRGNDINIAR